MKNGDVPEAAVGRISLYLRHLEQLRREGRQRTSSGRIARRLHLSDAQVRRDLAYFGHFGRPGLGYEVDGLIDALRGVLGTDKSWAVIVVGVGDLGRALLRYRGFQRRSFRIVAAFDVAPGKIGRRVGGVRVHALEDLERVVTEQEVHLAILTVPAAAANDVAGRLVDAGAEGILNFSPTTLQVAERAAVKPVDVGASLEQLAFQVARKQTAR